MGLTALLRPVLRHAVRQNGSIPMSRSRSTVSILGRCSNSSRSRIPPFNNGSSGLLTLQLSRNASTLDTSSSLLIDNPSVQEALLSSFSPGSTSDVEIAVKSLNEAGTGTPRVVGHLFSDAAPVLATGELLQGIHGIPGMDWTKTILLTTLGIRLLIGLPVAISQHKSMAKLENLQPEFKQLAADLARETSIATQTYKWDEKKANSAFKSSFKRHWRKLVEDNNCHPLRAVFLTWLQIPFWLGFSCALRNIVYVLPEPRTPDMVLSWMQIAGESPLWIESLAAADPFILPGIFLAANLLNLQLNSVRKLTVPQTKLQKAIPWVFRGGIVGISVFAAFTPSAVTLYWATSSVAVLLQNILMKTKPVRRFFRIPSTPTRPH